MVGNGSLFTICLFVLKLSRVAFCFITPSAPTPRPPLRNVVGTGDICGVVTLFHHSGIVLFDNLRPILRQASKFLPVLVKKYSHSVFISYQVVITVFVETDQSLPVPATKVEDEDADQPTLIFNLYCPKLSKSADVDLPHAMQKIMTGETWWRSFYEIPVELCE